MRVVVSMLALAGMTWAAAPPAPLTPEQARLLRERNTLAQAGQKAWQEKKQAEAIAALGKALAIDSRLFGSWDRAVETTADSLGHVHQARGEWGKEAEYRLVVIEARRRLDGEDHWRTVDARLALAEALAQPKRTAAQRADLARAKALNIEYLTLHYSGQFSRAIPLAKRALEIRKQVLGEKHPHCIADLGNLSMTYHKLGDYRSSLALLQKALEIKKHVLGENHPSYAKSLDNLAVLYKDMGNLRSALPLFRQALEIRKRALGERHADYASTLNNLAALCKDMGDNRLALTLVQKSQEITRQALGEKHPRYATSLNNLASLHRGMGDYRSALPLFQKAQEILRQALGVKHPHYATGLDNLAGLYTEMGDHKAALALFQKALEIRRQALGEKHPDYATSLNNIAQLHHVMGDHQSALSLSRKAVEIRRQAQGEKHPDYTTSLNNLAALSKEMGDHQAALALFQKALEIRKQAQGEKHPDYAGSLHNLATLYAEMGDLGSALPLSQKALQILRRALGEKHPDYAGGLHNLARLHKAMGEHKAALSLYQEALEIRRQALGEKHPHYAQSLDGLAVLYSVMGDRRSALPLLRKALEITRQALGEKHPDYATGLNNLAGVYREMGEHKAALPLYQEALEIRKQALGEKHPTYASGLHNLALLYAEMGDLRSALSRYQEALEIKKQVMGERHPSNGTSLLNLGGVYTGMRDYKAALPLHLEALEITRHALGEKHPDYAQNLHNLAVLYREMNRPGTALTLAEQAMALTRRQLALDASVQSERQQREAADALRNRLNQRLSIPDELAHFGHNHVLGWKGSTFAAQQARRRFLLTEADPATRALALELRDATRTLSLLAPRTDAESRKRTEEVLLRKEALEVRLARASADFRLAVRPPTSEAFRAGLPAGAVLLDCLVHTGLDPEKPRKGQEVQRRLVVWVVRSDAPTVRLDLGPMKDVEEALTAWRRAIEKGGDTPAAGRVRQLVWQPLERHVRDAKAVLISPDGALGRLPFAALPGREEGKVLLEEVPLAILPVPQVLAQVLRPVKGDPSMLTLGGVDFGDGDDPWVPLPATGPEADAIAKRFRGLFKGEAFALRGAKATKAALAGALAKHRFAHLATHGYFAPEGMRSYLGRDDKGKPDLFGREGVSGFDPALLSGLVLAGANRPTLADDGLLKASEVAEMDLSGVELAVLSACQTGLGKEAAGEGILGLQRAFAVSGCKTVVSSLWRVHDAATAVLMERFYDNLWKKRLGKLEALRQAQLEVMRHPEWVEERAKAMRGTPGLRGSGKAADLVVGGKKERRSPVEWWGAWQLSGDWR